MTERLIVDAFNFIHFIRSRAGSRAAPKTVEDCVYYLENYSYASGRDITLVFDGTRFEGGLAPSKALRIVFSRPEETADAVVERTMAGIPRAERLEWVLVSDDTALRRMAEGFGLRTMRPADLVEAIEKGGGRKKDPRAAEPWRTEPFNNPFLEKL